MTQLTVYSRVRGRQTLTIGAPVTAAGVVRRPQPIILEEEDGKLIVCDISKLS